MESNEQPPIIDTQTYQAELAHVHNMLLAEEAKRTRIRWLFVLVTCLVVIANFLPRFWSPFVYTDHGTVLSEYCAGDDLVLRFSGWSDGIPRILFIDGYLQSVEDGKRYFYPTDRVIRDGWAMPSRTIDFIYRDRTIPNDIPPGTYIYTHSNRAENGRTSSITFDGITVLECE